jgi:hypothetical protein
MAPEAALRVANTLQPDETDQLSQLTRHTGR